ncbi:MAG: cobalamin biosynthesis protein CbiA [Desulfococcus sp.]|nr:hypothetical protein [Desulfococcus multivorans]AOY59285.1 conserved uncharacterized protein [Desulfococcus multivorans]
MNIHLSGIVIIVGNYGSGKTEVAVNLAVNQRQSGRHVRIGDLDLVNPYFRTREAKTALNDLGIDVVLPPSEYFHADLPILTPAIAGMIQAPGQLVILDAGGDDAGATVLAALADPLRGKNIRMLQVVNPFRPFTHTLEGCLKIKKEIEIASKLNVNGIIGNANLIDDTVVQDIYDGYDFVNTYATESRLPLEFITARESLIPELDLSRFSCPVLPILRQLVPPWKTAATIGSGRLKI